MAYMEMIHVMAVVSRTSISRLINIGDIVVSPYDPDRVNNCSIDISWSGYYFRQRRYFPSIPTTSLYGGSTQGAIHYSPPIVCPYKDKSEDDWITPWEEQGRFSNEIIIEPNELILVISNEFIGSRKRCTTMAKTKSSIARLGLECFGSAGWGDIGYINRWAFPLYNRTIFAIKLRAGTWIAQIIFLSVSDTEESYTSGGNYQNTNDLDELIANWKPESVLPKPLSYHNINDARVKRMETQLEQIRGEYTQLSKQRDKEILQLTSQRDELNRKLNDAERKSPAPSDSKSGIRQLFRS